MGGFCSQIPELANKMDDSYFSYGFDEDYQ